jgi:ribonuclease Z
MHSTAKEAAAIAKKANVGQLILGHYSGRYKNTSLFKEEASLLFENVLLASDGKVFEL